MKVLWDLRLFSYGYAARGVGRHAELMTRGYLRENRGDELLAWGERERAPEQLRNGPLRWIPYRPGNWKWDLLAVPLIIHRFRPDVFHYWVALGPCYQIGLGALHGSRTVATVHDAGVERWSDDDFLRERRRSRYWKCQKVLAGRLDGVACVSRTTEQQLTDMLPHLCGKTRVIRLPMVQTNAASPPRPREGYLLSLGGAPNKNLPRVLEAFRRLAASRPGLELVICGDTGDLDGNTGLPPRVRVEPMSRYSAHLRRASAFLFCSFHEGFGIPPLEAMAAGCPLVAGDIEPLHETCEGAARFVDPFSADAIAAGIEEVLGDTEKYARLSRVGGRRYRERSADSVEHLRRLYCDVGRCRNRRGTG